MLKLQQLDLRKSFIVPGEFCSGEDAHWSKKKQSTPHLQSQLRLNNTVESIQKGTICFLFEH